MKDSYDVVIVGSGLGGLVSANLLAQEGLSVCLLEKNQQFGGNLQTFSRDKVIFDTGVHYIGGLSEGQNLHSFFNYLGIMNELKLQALDKDGFDIVTFDDDPREYAYAQGYEAFASKLIAQFPEDSQAIEAYIETMKSVCDSFPLYNLKYGEGGYLNSDVFRLGVKDLIDSLTENKKLRAVLAGTNILYAGDNETPIYVHALSVNSYIQSSYRCINGGSQLTKVLLKRLKENGGEAYKRHEVDTFSLTDNKIISVGLKNGKTVKGNMFISNIEPKLTLEMVGEKYFRKSFINRIKSISNGIGAFSIYIVLKPDSFPYYNKNFYHWKDEDSPWAALDYTEENWPLGYMASMGVKKEQGPFGESLIAMTYMRFEEVETWAGTFNTAADKNERGQTYEEFKHAKTERFLDVLEQKFPDLRDCIKAVYTSTPLSYRDYIGSHRGSMYGYVKGIENPMRAIISPKTKIPNLFFTGQSLNMHGVLGVTIGAINTCSEILGRDYLVNKILNYENTVINS
ncbi:phytoene desaturase family protein [Algoriphagus chordae]|uniref:All-trans-retinol 13,14-reductase n=1 Tax=Algoriphagus chordae TaxID=237019 RepID=A0A2W7QN66_9BACT|nr:NAD(P)/FAD-dependent oxidoreductase [Algoriphagus chordae]PZX48716.1 all-trans-retinol 13,14-reductase [Algoriphagus chordae]